MKLADKRKRFYMKIYVYKKRRAKYKVEGKKDELYNATKKISQWNNEIRRIDKRTLAALNLVLAVNEYFEVDIKARIFNKKYNLARNIFYKYGMEHCLRGTLLSHSLGRARGKTAGECRLRFTKTFHFKPENKEIYHRFKLYMENNAQKAA